MIDAETLPKAPTSVVPPDYIEELLSYAKTVPAGCFVEVGVWKGGTAWHLSQLCQQEGRQLFLYDTFTGMPIYDPALDCHPLGDFGDTSVEEVAAAVPHATIVAGVFPGSAVPMPPIAFAHVDCDQYQSVKEAAQFLLPKMVQGGILWFDDFNHLPGATKAVYEVFGNWVEQSPVGRKAFVRK